MGSLCSSLADRARAQQIHDLEASAQSWEDLHDACGETEQALKTEFQETIPPKQKKAKKARRKLASPMKRQSVKLKECTETLARVEDLRRRLAEALDESIESEWGIHPKPLVAKTAQQLEDYRGSREGFEKLEKRLRLIIDDSKSVEQGILTERIKQTTEWCRRLQKVVRRFDVGLDCANQIVREIDDVLRPLQTTQDWADDTRHELRREMGHCDLAITRVQKERQKLLLAAAESSELQLAPMSETANETATSSAPDTTDTTGPSMHTSSAS